MVLYETLESSLDYKEIQPVHPKGNQSWIFTGRTDAEAETPILWPPNAKNWLILKDPISAIPFWPEGFLLIDQLLSLWESLCVLCVVSPLLLLIFVLCVWSLLIWLICVLGCFALGLSCILSRVKQITSPGWMHETSAHTWCTGKTQRDWVEREVGGGIRMGNTCISMADSCQCMTKTTTIL